MSCCCGLHADWVVEDFAQPAVTRSLQSLARRGLPQWWLDLRRCTACGQHWLVAQDERMHDVWVMHRLNERTAHTALEQGLWPSDLDAYEAVIRLGSDWGHAATYCNPLETWPMAIDLIGQRRDISTAELAALLNIGQADAAAVATHARRAIGARGYPYPWQGAGEDEYEPT